MADDPFSPDGLVKLVGFDVLDKSVIEDIKLIVRKKLKRLSELCKTFEQLVLHLKKVHAQPHSEKYELRATLKDKGKIYTTDVTHKDLPLALEEALENLESEASKAKTL
ncbi:hypothetical protein HYU18_01995 [Candidatus Woesearchaeota archaeon]|nr:hypothetical protein [Candidatus Woesearchaeota archaeon]